MVDTGTRIFLPEIPGVGIIRRRYPIMPAHTEGSTTEKNLDALQVRKMSHVTRKHVFGDMRPGKT